MSIDIDVGSRAVGVKNKGENDANVHDFLSEYAVGKIEEVALPLFVDLFEDLGVPATFAVRGQLADVDSSAIDCLLDSPIELDIGAHGYSHRRFGSLHCREAENELLMISAAMRKLGVVPRSFVFPANSIAYLNLLEKYGYLCYRSYGDFLHDSMCIEKRGDLYNIHPSIFIDQSPNSFFLDKILDVAISKRAPVHFWFHLWNFGNTEESIQRSIKREILPFLKSARKKADAGKLSFETMFSAAKKIKAALRVEADN